MHELWTTRLLAAMRASADRRRVTNVRRLAQGTVCKLLGQEEIKPPRCATIWNARREFEQDGGSSVCLPRGPGPEKSRCQGGESTSRSRSSLTTRSLDPGHRHDGPDLPPVPGRHASFARDHEYNAMARSACWPGSICSPARSTRSSGSATAPRVIDSSSFSMPPIRPARDQADPRQLRHISREPEPGSTPGRQAASTLPSRPSRLLAQPDRGLLL